MSSMDTESVLKQGHPVPQLVSITRGCMGGWCVAVLIGDYYEYLRYFGYTKAEAKLLAKRDAIKIANDYYTCS